MEEVNSYLPKDLTIWVDPGEVSFSIGEKGQVRLLYSERRNASETSPTAPNTYNNTSAGLCTYIPAVTACLLGSPWDGHKSHQEAVQCSDGLLSGSRRDNYVKLSHFDRIGWRINHPVD